MKRRAAKQSDESREMGMGVGIRSAAEATVRSTHTSRSRVEC